MKAITEFRGENRYLSNFYPCRIHYENMCYPSVEHAYQAAKSLDPETRAWIAQMEKPGQAKAAGGRVTLRADWNLVKETIMLDLLRVKFQGPLGRVLMGTGNVKLVETNTWGDTFWGVCNGEGQNRLGCLLMKVRGELIREGRPRRYADARR